MSHRVELKTTDMDARSPFPPKRLELDHEELLNMVKMLGHDIRGSLVSVAAGLRLLQTGRYGVVDGRASEELERILSTVKGLMGLLEDAVGKAFSVEEGFDLDTRCVDLRRNVIQPVLEELSKEIRNRSITLEDRGSRRGPIRVLGDAFWIKSVFRNLLKNAIQHGGRGIRITLDYEHCEKFVKCNVFNSGAPIPRQYRRDLFKKFGPVSKGISEKQGGLGLGLYLVNEIIQKHGGEIRYEAREDDLFLRFAERILLPTHQDRHGLIKKLRSYVIGYRRPTYSRPDPGNPLQMLRDEARKSIWQDAQLQEILEGGEAPDMDEIWFSFVDGISEKTLKRFADSILESFSGANLFDIFHTIGSVGSLYLVLAPYFVAYTLFTKDRRFCRMCRDHFEKNVDPDEKRLKIAHFTDTFNDMNGVAQTLQMQVAVARKNRKQLNILTCGPDAAVPGVVNFQPIGTFDLPEYPEVKMYYPPFLKMLQYCYEQGFNQIHAATPGPAGLAALLIARILKLPFLGTYHTALPQYVNLLTGDASMEELTWKYVLWFYNQMDAVYAPSRATAEELEAKGLDQSKLRLYPRGIDIQGFHPSKRNGFFRRRYKVKDDEIKLLYVGRVSKEKNLPYLVEVFRKLSPLRPGVRLIVVGDGPYLQEMKGLTADLPVTFTGYLRGEDLAQAYASSHLFVFPSATDTFGNVVLEAQASGLPVIVSLEGGPKENLVHGKTGFAVSTSDHDAFLNALLQLVDESELRDSMGKSARAYMEDRSFESAYMELWESYRSSGAAA